MRALSHLAGVFAGIALVASLSAQGLDEALAEARRELAAERARIERQEAAQQAVLDDLIRRRDELSSRMVDLRLAKPGDASAIAVLRERRAALRAEVDELKAATEEAPRVVTNGADKIADMLDVVPPLGATSPAIPDSLDTLMTSMATLLDRVRDEVVFSARVRVPDGRELPASMLRIGLMTWAYRLDDGTVALAMSAPGREESYRWREELVPQQADLVRAAFAAVERDSDETVIFPVDVTQQMAIESQTRLTSPWATITAGGPVMVPLGAVAILALLLIVERMIFLARVGWGSARYARSVANHIDKGGVTDAAELCAGRANPVARALHACLKHRDHGAEAMEDAVQEVILHEVPRLERFLSTIGILASVAPLLGLLGTVTGMILTFEMIATLGSGNPRMMAGGISQALITTAAGLIVAIPILLMHSFLSGRVDRVIADIERFAAELLNRLRGEPRS